MHRLRRDLRERRQHEVPQMHPRVRHNRVRAVADEIVVEQQIKIERPRPVLLGAGSAELLLHCQ
jgi:hypothetical protein